MAVHHRDLLHYLGPIAAVTAGIHEHAATDGAGHSHEDVQPGKAGFGRPARGEGSGKTSADGPAILILLQPVQALSHPDHQGVQSFIREQDVGAESQGEPWSAGFAGQTKGRRNIGWSLGQQHSGRPADPIGGVAGDGLPFPHRPGNPIPQRSDEVRAAGAHPVHSGDISRASACHSCSGRTSPARLLSAMTASHAAEAADNVVVYGTRCWRAARRMA